ncbi:hypothetical protein RIF29_19928 [Crotalaria pallida]|uniref:Uncharacterized protein n=1 Tax=Crotalaria pallida TaxID=3830 RepID=A0AAN9F1L0_CROPI
MAKREDIVHYRHTKVQITDQYIQHYIYSRGGLKTAEKLELLHDLGLLQVHDGGDGVNGQGAQLDIAEIDYFGLHRVHDGGDGVDG